MSGGKLLIASRCCNQCLFGPNKVVSNTRKRSLLRDCVALDTHFVCHKATTRGASENMVCRGFFETYRSTGQLLRIAQRLGVVAFADPDTGEEQS